jgi:hypothetical protein
MYLHAASVAQNCSTIAGHVIMRTPTCRNPDPVLIMFLHSDIYRIDEVLA